MSEKPRKVVVICHTYEPEHTPNKPDEDNRFYTYGFGGSMGRILKKYNPEYEVEVWRLDGYTKEYNEKEVAGVNYRIFPSFHRPNIVDFSFKFLRALKKEINRMILYCRNTHQLLGCLHGAFFFKKSKIVTTHHGDWSPFYRVHNTKGLRKLKARLDMFIEKRVYKNIVMY